MKQRPPDNRPRIRGGAPLLAAGAAALLAQVFAPAPSSARDTDLFKESSGSNAYILVDASGSMNYPVYESSIDYARLYDWYWDKDGTQLATLIADAAAADTAGDTRASDYNSSCSGGGCSVRDHRGKADGYKGKHFDRDTIYLVHNAHAKNYIGKMPTAPANSEDPDDYVEMTTDWLYAPRWFYSSCTANNLKTVPSACDWVHTNTGEGGDFVVNTHTKLVNGALVGDGLGAQRLTLNAEGYVLLDNTQLPYSQKIKLTDPTELKPKTKGGDIPRGASIVDNGLAGQLSAPGYYSSGFSIVSGTNPTIFSSVSGTPPTPTSLGTRDYAWLLVTGNYLNFLQSLGLQLNSGGTKLSKTPENAESDMQDLNKNPMYRANFLTSVVPYPMSEEEWPDLGYKLKYPEGDEDYAPGESGVGNARAVEAPGAEMMRLRFASLDLGAGDHLYLYAGEGKDARQLADYTSANNSAAGFWTPPFATDVVTLKLVSDDDASVGKGYYVDRFRFADHFKSSGEPIHLLQARHTVAREALNIILDKFTDMRWGYYEYWPGKGVKRNGTSSASVAPSYAIGDGKASSTPNYVDLLAKSDNQEQADLVKQALANFRPAGQTPTQMALQEVWLYGFHNIRDTLKEESCFDNMIIHLTDGFPTGDTNFSKFRDFGLSFPVTPPGAKNSGAAGSFADWDGDGLRGGNNSEFDEYYDDMSQWMYEHSWLDGSETSDAKLRVTVHNVAFGARMAILKNASAQSPGSMYLMASNKAQLIAAFSAIAGTSGDAASFAAPTVSLEAGSTLTSGTDIYSGNFFPMSDGFWVGNVKKYKMGDGSAERPDKNAIYGLGDASLTTPPLYEFKGGADYWGDLNCKPNVQDKDGNNLMDDGAGEKMLKALAGDRCDGNGGYFAAGTYYARPIYAAVRNAADDGWDLVRFNLENIGDDKPITPAMLDAGDVNEAWRILNFVHGYTAEANGDGTPVATRPWPLGAIIHSQPVTLDYTEEVEDPSTGRKTERLKQRYIAVGSNDGMLHVFDDDGNEVFSFIPNDMLPRLKEMLTPSEYGFDGVDGRVTVVTGTLDTDKFEASTEVEKMQPTYLVFGERRGGPHYWCLNLTKRGVNGEDGPPSTDVSDWRVQWNFAPDEIAQSWSNVAIARVLTDINATTGKREYRRVAIFSGGYDPIEDNFPEPFKEGATPLDDDGAVDSSRWTPTLDIQDGVQQYDSSGNKKYKKTEHDPNGNGVYDIQNPGELETDAATGEEYWVYDRRGRGVWIVDLEDPTAERGKMTVCEKDADGNPTTTCVEEPILPFSVTWGRENEEKLVGSSQKRNDMIYCFPATPSVVSATEVYYDAEHKRHTVYAVLRALYVPDIYANMWKVRLDLVPFESEDEVWSLKGLNHSETKSDYGDWKVNHIFSSRYTVNSLTGKCPAGADCELDKSLDARAPDEGGTRHVRDLDRGQKAFYSPSVSWGGTRGRFESRNFNYADPDHGRFTFRGRDSIATLFFGTGDPEHPNYAITHNRLYTLYDDTAITAQEQMVVSEFANQDDDDDGMTTVTVTLPDEDGDYTVTANGDSVVVEINLTRDYTGTVAIPCNAGRVVVNTNGHTLKGADGDWGASDGKSALRLCNAGTQVVVNGSGAIQGGKGRDALKTEPATLTEKCEFTSPVTAADAVVEITLEHDCDDSTLEVPANVKTLILNMNGHKIEADDAQNDGENGKSPIRLANPNTTLVITGEGELESGDGKHGGNGGDLILGAGENTVVYISADVELDYGKGEDDGKEGSFCGLKADGSDLCRQDADKAYSSVNSGQAGNGGQAMRGADSGTNIYTPGGAATVAGGAGGAGVDGSTGGQAGGICGLDASNAEICAVSNDDPPTIGAGSGGGAGSGTDPGSQAAELRSYSRVGALYDEADLMNLTCGETDEETEFSSCYLTGLDCGDNVTAAIKKRLATLLTDNAIIDSGPDKNKLEEEKCREEGGKMVCEPEEDDFKGWYIVLDKQADTNYCSHVSSWRNSVDTEVVDNHVGEQIMARTTLFAGVLYFTTFQPGEDEDDHCGHIGNGRIYSLAYGDASSVYGSWTKYVTPKNYGDAIGRFKTFENIGGVPSSMTVTSDEDGTKRSQVSMGGMIAGASPATQQGLGDLNSNPPLHLLFWRDSNSKQEERLYNYCQVDEDGNVLNPGDCK